MKYLTAEEIAAKADGKDGIANIREINRLFRRQDESHLWPINGKFNATERAIRKARRFQRQTGEAMYGYEYALYLECEISEIVNNSDNW